MKTADIKKLVIDASVTLAWCFPDESTVYTGRVRIFLPMALKHWPPAIWLFEVANALLMGEKRKRTTIAQVTSVLQRIADLPITVEPIRVDRTFGSDIIVSPSRAVV